MKPLHGIRPSDQEEIEDPDDLHKTEKELEKTEKEAEHELPVAILARVRWFNEHIDSALKKPPTKEQLLYALRSARHAARCTKAPTTFPKNKIYSRIDIVVATYRKTHAKELNQYCAVQKHLLHNQVERGISSPSEKPAILTKENPAKPVYRSYGSLQLCDCLGSWTRDCTDEKQQQLNNEVQELLLTFPERERRSMELFYYFYSKDSNRLRLIAHDFNVTPQEISDTIWSVRRQLRVAYNKKHAIPPNPSSSSNRSVVLMATAMENNQKQPESPVDPLSRVENHQNRHLLSTNETGIALSPRKMKRLVRESER